MAEHEPNVACSVPELSGELRGALETLRDLSGSDDFRALVDDVLAGRRDLMDASGTAAFAEVVFAQMAQELEANPAQLAEELAGCSDATAGGCSDGSSGCADHTDHAAPGCPPEAGANGDGPCGGCPGGGICGASAFRTASGN